MFQLPYHADEIHVISDLHLGGHAGFQIFREGPALQSYIRALPRDRSCCLVINGDFVDFLAESPSRHFDPAGAVAKLQRVAADPGFAPVFQALAEFVRTPNAQLAIVLGNHDVELALPWVRAELLRILCAGEAEAASRILFSLEGQGVLLHVGGPSGPAVLCLHGNEVDAWNVVDHDRVRVFGREGLRGNRLDEDWMPNAGSRMVVEVMNEIKREFPFVDLLKPETAAVMPILLALKPSAAAKLGTLAALVATRTVDDARIRAGFLGDGETDEFVAERPLAGDAAALDPVQRGIPRKVAVELMDRAERRLSDDTLPLDLLGADARREYLGTFGAAVGLLKGDVVEALREQLESLEKDRSFDYAERDETYRALHARVSTHIDYLVAGHTHLPRAIERELGRSYYFNTGTWARVLRLAPHARRNPAQFRRVYAALKAGTMDALDGVDGLEAQRPHVAVLASEGGKVFGELRTVAAQAPHAWAPVAGTRFGRS